MYPQLASDFLVFFFNFFVEVTFFFMLSNYYPRLPCFRSLDTFSVLLCFLIFFDIPRYIQHAVLDFISTFG